MKIIAFAEQREGKFKKVAYEAVHTAAQLANQLGAEAVALIIGKDVEKIAPELGGYGIKKVYVAEDERLNFYSVTSYAKIVADAGESLSADIILLPASAMGKESVRELPQD